MPVLHAVPGAELQWIGPTLWLNVGSILTRQFSDNDKTMFTANTFPTCNNYGTIQEREKREVLQHNPS